MSDAEVIHLEVVQGMLPLTEACKHYSHVSELSDELKKYFFQRRGLFQSYDDEYYDIRLTDEAWFGVTPEAVAYRIAGDMASTSASPVRPSAPGPNKRRKVSADSSVAPDPDPECRPLVVVDLFAGVGGNTVAFANSPDKYSRVIGIEWDPSTLACAQHNAAQLCDDPSRITWLRGNCFEFLDLLRRAHGLRGCMSGKAPFATTGDPAGESLSSCRALLELVRSLDPSSTVIFGSPPWGGPSYLDKPVFNLLTMEPYCITELHYACAPWAHALYLPRTSDLRHISALVPAEQEHKIDVKQYYMKGACKALVAYFPPQWEELDEAEEVASDRVQGTPLPVAANDLQQGGKKRKLADVDLYSDH